MESIGNDIINPALMLAISRMKEHNNQDTQNKMVEEALNARFLVPCEMKFAPGTEHEQKRTPANTFPNINLIKTTEGKLYFMAFTDMGELKKWQDKDGQNVLIMSFDDVAGLALNPKSNTEGFVINPSTTNVVFQNQLIATILHNRDQAIKDGKMHVVSPKEMEIKRRKQETELS
ncbi:MAG: SseB family protein [Lachnospiraceae bacterium]|nr:SseB family protein [Lachnospiraceae bacterium]